MTDKYIPTGLEKELIDAKYLVIKNIYGDEGDLQYRDVLYCKKCNKLLASFDRRTLAHLWRFHTIKPKALREKVWQELGQVWPTLEEAS